MIIEWLLLMTLTTMDGAGEIETVRFNDEAGCLAVRKVFLEETRGRYLTKSANCIRIIKPEGFKFE